MRSHLFRNLAFFLLGFLLGAVTINVLLGYQVDELSLDRQELTVKLRATEEELAELKEKLVSRQRSLITSVEAHILLKGNLPSNYEGESLRLVLEEKAKALLIPWRGREARSIDYFAIPQVFAGRLIEVEGQQFRLNVDMIVITDKLSVYLNATPAK